MNEMELEGLCHVLAQLADMAEHASLTGALSGGEKRAVNKYNAILEKLAAAGRVPQGIYESLPENVGFSEIAVEARLLASHCQSNDDRQGETAQSASMLIRLAPFLDAKDLGTLVKEQLRQGRGMDPELLTGLAPFLEQSDLSDLIRRSIFPPPQSPQSPHSPVREEAAEIRTEDVLDLLKNPHLSVEERDALIARLEQTLR
jgi:hypothetical protein